MADELRYVETVQSGNTAYSTEIAHFVAKKAVPLQSLKVAFTPIQAGSGDPSPSNVRAISGRTGVSATRAGVNLLQCDTYADITTHNVTFTGSRNSNNEIEYVTVKGKSDYNNIFRNLNYTANKCKLLSAKVATCAYSDAANISPVADSAIYDQDGNKSYNMAYAGWHTFEIPNPPTPSWVRIQMYPYSTINVDFDTTVYPMMCLASDQGCAYEPYKGKNYSASWQSEAGTVYGGYMDLVSGTLVEEYFLYTFDSTNANTFSDFYGASTDYPRIVRYNFSYDKQDGILMSNKAIVYNTYYSEVDNSNAPCVCSSITDNAFAIVFPTSYNLQTLAEARNWISNNPISIVFKRETPITYQLTPQEIKTFLGVNNIWSTDGTVEAKYTPMAELNLLSHRQRILMMNNDHVPPGYTECDWLLTSGHNARIDTGVTGDDNTLRIKGEFMPIELNDSYEGVFGNYKTENDHYCWRCILYNKTTTGYDRSFYITMGNNSAGGSGTAGMSPVGSNETSVGVKATIDVTYGQCTMTGTVTKTSTISYAEKLANTDNIIIGASRANTSGGTTKFRLYNWKLWSQGKLIRDYRPCTRWRDNKAGFYDMVNHTFNPSIGSTDFTAGND